MTKRRIASLFLMWVLLWAVTASSQQLTGALEGRVADTSGAVLPGVAVTISGPAILGGSRDVVSTDTGSYRLTNIPLGTYNVTFALSGFTTKIYEGIRIQADTTFTLNTELGVAGIEETVTVTGESPIIETKATDASFTFTNELMETVPNARDLWAIVGQAPGVSSGGYNVGGTNTGNQLSFRGHGVDPRQNTYVLDGANITDMQNNGSSQFYLDVNSFQEVDLKVSAHTAEVQSPGMMVSIVPKSGSNNFHGNFSTYYTDEGIQADNVDDELRSLGVDRASNLKQYYDVGFDLGGPIIQDKLWFWGGYRRQNVENFVTGTQLADGSFPIDRTLLWFPGFKINWQVNQQHQFAFFYQLQEKARFNRALSLQRPPETTWDQFAKPKSRLLSFRDDWVASDNLLVSIKVNFVDGGFVLAAQEDVDLENTPSRYDVATGVWSDAPPYVFGVEQHKRSYGATASYFKDNWLGGQHDFKFGLDYRSNNQLGNQGGGALTTYPADHRLVFNNGTPIEVYLYAPGAQNVLNPNWNAFAQDAWQLGRVRLNLGVRWDWQANRLKESTAPQSRYFETAVTQPETDNLITWNTFTPRLGLIYDLTADAKTLLKASYGRYAWLLWIDKGVAASRAGDRTFRYEWLDRNGDNNFTEDELGALLSRSDPALSPVTIDEDLNPTMTEEFTVGVSRELMQNLSMEATFRYRKDTDLTWQIHPAVSAADYTTVQGTDPGRDGVLGTGDDGGSLTFYELDASKRVLSPNFITNQPGFEQQYQGFELTMYRRFADNWQLVGSFTTGVQKDDYSEGALRQLSSGTLQTPQDIDLIDGTRISDSKPYIFKLMGSYQFPHNVTLSGFWQYLSGDNFTRTVTASSALGRSLNQGNITVLSGTRNEESYDAVNLLDLRLEYDLNLERFRTSFAFDMFNLLNTNRITGIVTNSGSRYGAVSGFIPPRIFRFGVKIGF